MGQGGSRPGAGRPKGSANKRTREIQARIEASGLSPLDYMLGVMSDQSADPAMRLDAAKAAAPYVHARLSATEITTSDPRDNADPEQVMAQIRALVAANPELADMLSESVASEAGYA
jgi:hypothetical protein